MPTKKRAAAVKAGSRTARRARMVGAALGGKSTSAIARAEGLSRDWAGRELKSAESRQIVAGLVNSSLARVKKLYIQLLDTIEAGMAADRIVADRTGCALNLGPDHYARLTAAKRYLELVTAGRSAPRQAEEANEKQTITLEELRELVESKPVLN